MTTRLTTRRHSGRRQAAWIALVTAAVLGGFTGFATAGAATFTSQASAAPPVVTAISPQSGPAGGGTPVTITGSGFATTPGITTVTFAGTPASAVTCSSTTTCTVISPPGLGPQVVIVTVAGQSSSGSAASTFAGRPPVALAMTPTNGPTGGGTIVTISGVNFDTVPGATLVNFGSTPATSVTCPSPTTCMATSPPGTGAAFVAVIEDGFSIPATSSASFTYVTPPVGQISCGVTVTQSITLTQDLGPCPGNGLVVAASGITVDLAGHRLFGTAGAGDNRVGIELSGVTGDTVTGDATPKSTRTGDIDGFASGISIDGGGHNAIIRLDVHDNVSTSVTGNRGDGIVIGSGAASSHNLISNSVITHNGVFDGVGVFSAQSKGNQILNSRITDNNVAGVFADGSAAHVDEGVNLGFGLEGSNATTISGNTISRNGLNGIDACSPDGGGPCVSVGDIITGNLIEANGTPGVVSSGINISIYVAGPNPIVASTDTISGNRVLNNLGVGIFVNNPGNSITNNVALGNSTDPTALKFGAPYDLYDGTASCDHNTWRGNTYDANEAYPACAGKNGTS